MGEGFKCPKCGNEDTVRIGSSLSQKWGKRPRRQCKQCAKTFYEDVAKIENKEVKE